MTRVAGAASGARVVVVGGGLAGMAAALGAADAGAHVTLVEKRQRLGGLTWSFKRKDLVFDNGQHVFLRCCTAYRAFLDRIGAADKVHLQQRLDVPVLAPGRRTAHIARTAAPLPSPLHLGASLLSFGHLSLAARARLLEPVLALRKLTLEDPALDDVSFGEWLASRGQSARAIERLWDLVVLPTVNARSAEASLALAAKVFRTGLLDTVDGADIGWAAVPLGELHGDHGMRALEAAGVEVAVGEAVHTVETFEPFESGDAGPGDAGPLAVHTRGRRLDADAVVVALPHDAAPGVLPPGTLGDLSGLGRSPIVNVHLVLDRTVTDLPLAAAVTSPVQYVFDHTEASGIPSSSGRQCLVVSLSDATAWVGARPDDLVRTFHAALGELFPMARGAALVDGVVSREHAATFRGVPGTAPLRPGPVTRTPGVFVAGAWCATGWPATMEGAVRSGMDATAAALASLGSGEVPARHLAGASA
ncbi:MAG TPA: hydroxysqualene dehydroxylase HpnE [Acidimicrobiales bacterium]|nr:hydroxysqualene dehydroxylase HpnE [Acidimicrobiales bacterium]